MLLAKQDHPVLGLFIVLCLLGFLVAPTILIVLAWRHNRREREREAARDLQAAQQTMTSLQQIERLVGDGHNREARLEHRVEMLEAVVRRLSEKL